MHFTKYSLALGVFTETLQRYGAENGHYTHLHCDKQQDGSIQPHVVSRERNFHGYFQRDRSAY